MRVENLEVPVFENPRELAHAAAWHAAQVVASALAERRTAHVMFASGNSQLDFLAALAEPAMREVVDWSNVMAFHMDEYVGISADHPASFRRYMRDRVVARLRPAAFQELTGDAPDPEVEAQRYAALLRTHPLDLCCVGIGENGHLAFNDPPAADFDDPVDAKVVSLDEACRHQQVGEGHFAAVDEVPARAITVTIPALLRARTVVAIVPEARKAEAVRRALEGPVTTACPASILRRCARATLYLDRESASYLQGVR